LDRASAARHNVRNTLLPVRWSNLILTDGKLAVRMHQLLEIKSRKDNLNFLRDSRRKSVNSNFSVLQW
jgi:hypothetical protein